MSLRLIAGRANTGKTGTALGIVREAHAAGRSPILILPSQPDAQRAADELAMTNPLGFRVMTFDSYLADAWGKFGDGRAIVAPSARRMLVMGAARMAGAGSGMGGLAGECVTTLSQQLGEAWRQADPGSDCVRGALMETILNYRDALGRHGLVEREEAAFALSNEPGIPGDPLVVHRFVDFAPWQESLVLGAARSRDVAVALTWEDGFPPTRALDDLVRRLDPAVTVIDGPTFHTDPELTHVADLLYATPSTITPSDCLRFSLAEGHEAEAHRIAEEVRNSLAKCGNTDAHSSVVVVFRQPERHYRHLREAFIEAGIDADYDVRLPLDSTAFGSAVMAILGFCLSGEREHLLAALRSPFSGGSRQDVIKAEGDWRRRGVTDRVVLTSELRKVSPGLHRVVSSVQRTCRSPIDSGRAQILAGAVGELFVLGYGRCGAEQAIEPEDTAAHAAVQRVLGEVALLGTDSVPIKDLAEVLRHAIVTSHVEERPGVVQVAAVDRIRGRRYDTVIIGGLNSDEFPAPTSETMLSGSAVADVLSAFGGTGEAQRGSDYEQLLFYMALTRAQQKVVLSARTADSDGNPAGLSPLWEAVADFYRPDGEDSSPPATFRALSQTPRSTEVATERERLRARAQAGGGDDRSRAARWRSLARTAKLDEDSSLEQLTRSGVYSPSAIDAYLECPYRWFYSRTVRPTQLESEFDASAQGSFAHEVLARAYAALGTEGITRMRPGTLEAGRKAVNLAWATVDAEYDAPRTVLERSERRTTLAWATRLIEKDCTFARAFSPIALEWRFGFGDDDAVDLDGFQIRGIVDRIDADVAGHAIVIDYKRSGGPSAADILTKRKVQVPLYFEAVRRGLGVEPVAGLYRGLRTGEDRGLVLEEAGIEGAFKKGDVRSRAEFDATVDAALELARSAAAGMSAGRIEQKPFNPASCKKCDAFAVCGGAR